MQTEQFALRPVGLLLFSVCVSFYILLLGPLDAYIHNREEFFSVTSELIRLLSVAAVIVSALVFLLLLLMPRVLKGLLVRALAFLVLSAWIIANFFYGDYGQLDGTALDIDPRSSLALLQSLVWLTVLVAVVKVGLDNLFRLTAAVFVVALSAVAYGLLSMENDDEQRAPADFPAGLTEFSPGRNVLHVVLDELGSETFLLALDSDENLRAALEGFTVFTDTLSVYPSTEMSIVAMMTGEVYRNEGSKRSFIKRVRRKNLGVERLEALGYRLDSHSRCQLGVVSNCTMVNSSILNENVEDIEALQLLDIFLFKAVPDYLKPRIYNEEKWLLLDTSSHNKYLKFQSGVAHLLFARFIDEMSVAEDLAPRYKFFHSMVTHTPRDLGADCEVLDKEQSRSVSQLDFVRCGLSHFSRLLERLEELGIYDETMIILSSDHGDYEVYESLKVGKFGKRGIKPGMVTRASATLAVKPFGARGSLAMNPAQVSLRDIPHTILAAHELGPGDGASPGTRNVFAVNAEEDRAREYLYYVWEHKYWSEAELPPITTFRVTGNSRDPAAWPDLKATHSSAGSP